MRTTLNIIAVLIALAFLSACGGSDTDKADNNADGVAAERVRIMEDSLYAKPGMDRKGAQALLDVYLLYAKVHPLDSLTPEYLFRAASMKSNLGDPQGGIGLYDRIIRDFPSWRKISDTYYLKAFTIDNGLQQKGEAERAYTEVINRFPDHRFAQDAQQMIENLKYTDEELMQRFEAMNMDSAASQVAK